MWLFKWLWKKITGGPWEGGSAFDIDADEEGRREAEQWIEKK